DATEVGYKKERYEEVKVKVEEMIKSVGWDVSKTPIIPVSGWKGDNLIHKGDNLAWYDGKTIYQAFDDFEVIAPAVDKPLRLPLQDVYSITGVGTVPVGRVETGTFKVGDKVIIMPSGAIAEVKSIESHHVDMKQASAGDNIGFNLRGVDKKDIRRGDVIGPVDNPPKVAKEFTAQIIVVHHPTAIAPGYTPVIHAHTSQAAATITELVSKLDARTGGVLEEKPKALKTGDAAIVKIQPLRPLCLETFTEFPQLGRFALRDMGTTIAAGVVKEINAEWDLK
ncbi:MAG TPA: elongation factor 1-alpha, partial [Nitrososphaerales archaeon]|nr:elongation factor 1-alpha [Nitrososphaerales archaeon]